MPTPPEKVRPLRRPPILTTVGIVGILAGTLPTLEVGAVLTSQRFRAWFLPIVHAILPASAAIVLGLLLMIAAADVALGAGVLTRRRWAAPGMIFRSILGVGLDALNFQAHNFAGAWFGLAVNVFVVWALLRPTSRAWFRHANHSAGCSGPQCAPREFEVAGSRILRREGSAARPHQGDCSG